ncbi:hypothetical protein B0H19DRAFT_1072460 [Mycena capillaripes]|nr:hypothetical protein B0H19DRAFT_1072460 [Mycena capillaripes]
MASEKTSPDEQGAIDLQYTGSIIHRIQYEIFNLPDESPGRCGLKDDAQPRVIWAFRAAQSGGAARVKVIPDFSTATLNIIGQASFCPRRCASTVPYNVQSLDADSSGARIELHDVFATIFAAGDKPVLLDTLKGKVPILRWALWRIDKVIDNGIGQ